MSHIPGKQPFYSSASIDIEVANNRSPNKIVSSWDSQTTCYSPTSPTGPSSPSLARKQRANFEIQQRRAKVEEERQVWFETRRKTSQSKIRSIGKKFQDAQNKDEALSASRQAIHFYTTSSTYVNQPLRDGDPDPGLDAFKDAIDYGIQHAPDYGSPRKVNRRVDFSVPQLQSMFQEGCITDRAFTSTTESPIDREAVYPFRNTIMYIDASHAADVAHISPDPHFKEHLLPSDSKLSITRGHIEENPFKEKGIPTSPVKVELWLKQEEPSPDKTVLDPWKRDRYRRSTF